MYIFYIEYSKALLFRYFIIIIQIKDVKVASYNGIENPIIVLKASESEYIFVFGIDTCQGLFNNGK